MYKRQGDQLILIRFRNAISGIWNLKLVNLDQKPFELHAWLPNGDLISDSTFFIRANPYTTITSPGNARIPLTVSSYNPINDSFYIESSRGYNRAGIIKPDLACLLYTSYVDGLEKKLDSVTEELTKVREQIKEMQEDTLMNNLKKAVSEAADRLENRCNIIKDQIFEVKTNITTKATQIVNEAKRKRKEACLLYTSCFKVYLSLRCKVAT